MEPGTYRIVNLAHGTVITENNMGVVGYHTAGHKGLWFAQRSGEGYRFKNVVSGGYLAVASTVDHNCELYSSRYPTTWALTFNPEHRGHDLYGILMGDTDRILDLSSGADGTKARTCHIAFGEFAKSQISRFMRSLNPFMKDQPNTGCGNSYPIDEEVPDLARAQRAEETIKSQVAEIGYLRQLILDDRQEKAESRSKLSQLNQDITELKSQVGRLEVLLAERFATAA
ncbi:unnamed protein product [Rhizoctonia solani]|uniref:Ricin B lectin domain-containing protein n=1 Tax=Rhizoctonia solani TaxID=456999 RepID=A0A8H3DBF8_9AGAM|nr:unnamed protein product [Rhizoctonia solani]CAE6521189.1 unnamed protein product [Rhizoctonia solani]